MEEKNVTIKVSAQQLRTLTASKSTLISFKLIKVEGLVHSEPLVPPAVTIKETNFFVKFDTYKATSYLHS